MIVDIIPIPLKIPANEDIDMELPLWVEYPQGCEDLTFVSRNINSFSDLAFRYKIIDLVGNACIETVVLSTEKMNPFTLGNAEHRRGPVQLIPITTKVYTAKANETTVLAYRHLRGILTVLEELQYGALLLPGQANTYTGNLVSVHQMFLSAVAASMHKFNRPDYSLALSNFATKNRARLQTLLSAQEEDNCTLLSHIHSLSAYYVAELFDEEQQFVAMVDTMSRLPYIHPYDTVARLAFGRDHFDSVLLHNHLSPEYSRRMHMFRNPEHNVQDIAVSAYSMPGDLGHYSSPILNALELMPFSNISISFMLKQPPRVNFCNSIIGNVQPISRIKSSVMFKKDLQLNDDRVNLINQISLQQLQAMVESLIIGVCAYYNDQYGFTGINTPKRIPEHQVECTVLKTFTEDVYIKLCLPGSNWCKYFYFDLTMYALGTKGLLDLSSVSNFVDPGDQFWQFFNSLYSL